MFGVALSEWLVVASLILVTLFWIGMLLDAVLYEQVPGTRVLWAALIFLTWVPGALVYALLRSAPRRRAQWRRKRGLAPGREPG